MSFSSQHSHDFVGRHQRNERRTWFVVALTGVVMVIELIAGYLTGSMALTADGWHMGSHFGALSLAGLAYVYARKNASNTKFSFGAGKVYALAGYTNALLLAAAAVLMIVESVQRLINPIPINFLAALPVAFSGLIVNLFSALLLRDKHNHGEGEASTDHNLRAAYMHVLADALTSVTAIAALLTGYFLDWTAIDPLMGVVGGAIILNWSVGLSRGAMRQLLDMVPSPAKADLIREAIEAIDDCQVSDLHLWEIAPGRMGCIVALQTSTPRELDSYREAVTNAVTIHHLTIEISRHAPETGAEAD